MGNEQSQMSGIEIDEKVIGVSDFWSQHNATIASAGSLSKITLFTSDLFVEEPFWKQQQETPLEKFSKNTKIYRHPSIIKYIASWQKSSKFYLAVEEVTPLSHMLSHLSTMEICLGLYSILKALSFLHEKASVSHNNICIASILVSKDGKWKLGGMEYLCPYDNLTPDYIQRSGKYRFYDKAFNSEHLKHALKEKYVIDLIAFCAMAVDLFKNKNDGEPLNLSSFQTYCTKVLNEPKTLQMTTLTDLLEHAFFKHTFITIHSFLIELPMKTDLEKTEFFTNLRAELDGLNEELVASQLGGLLVSRLVLLNKVAKDCLLPYIMIPRKGNNGAIFSEDVFKKYIAPKLVRIFAVRDAQIRLLLLEYLPQCLESFSKDDLQYRILPELLVGIKDVNNDLVSSTLHILAELVPVLGADVVIGGERAKLFNDGRPNTRITPSSTSKYNLVSPIQDVFPSAVASTSSTNSVAELTHDRDLPERPRPDGEEGETSTDEIEQSADEDAGGNWEDWDDENATQQPAINDTCQPLDVENTSKQVSPIKEDTLLVPTESKNFARSKQKRIPDITELDIKNQAKLELEKNDFDFFEDMEPEIEASRKFVMDDKSEKGGGMSIFSVKSDQGEAEEGWGDDWE